MIFLIVTMALQLVGWYLALFYIGADVEQGNVYRIIFVHVPLAWCSFFWVFWGAGCGIFTLLKMKSKKLREAFDRRSHTAIELGTLFSFLMLVTGSIWGRPTWGIWWDWDPRLTSSLVMILVCCAYLILRHFTPELRAKQRSAAIVAILTAANVPIVYLSVNLWRSLHQPQTFFEKTTNASSDVSFVLFFNAIAMFLLSIAIYKVRKKAITVEEILEEKRGADALGVEI